ncbi:MAG: hypothetical protein E7574_05820 [Ruminococcaceae bacterium]|nr:hypothetical protein [Oscillospiraceae bacterium]
MNNKKVKFRNSMGGYNKEDVNSYIEMLSSKYYDAEADSRKTISELEKRINELEKENAEKGNIDTNEIEALKSDAEKSDSLIAELNETVSKLNGEKEELSRQIAELEAKINEYEKMTEVNSELYEKSSKYDQVSEQIGSMIVSANARAEGIVSEAELKARVISNSMIDSVYEKLTEVNEKYAKEIVTKTVQMTDELRALSLGAESFRAELRAEVENECQKIRETLETSKRVITEENE